MQHNVRHIGHDPAVPPTARGCPEATVVFGLACLAGWAALLAGVLL